MKQEKIDRINFLAKKAKSPEGLTSKEKDEQNALRREYVNEFKNNLVSQLENTYYIDDKGFKRKVERKNNGKADNN